MIADLDSRIAKLGAFLDDLEYRKALAELRAIWVAGNEYLTVAAPWTHFKTDKVKAAIGVRMGLNLVRLFAALSSPVVPGLAKAAAGAFGDVPDVIAWPDQPMADYLKHLKPGSQVTPPAVLVTKITDEQVEAWKTEFGGAE